ncbi:hypothetical protein GCM10011609_26720 [Lentzea pudingi]|uniref:Chemotaxis methyl-accepting receptor HlyB-like 4HB MCP domain-containing protein n=1 Tax=Lentzea pudingi TaxID=1789439 RepID=A0ABQ2HQE9_9PSEU|nr:hypothetical protein [Lentzea pudingi]GGM88625.1 hypothetical protein GCM10011609_26720 [Lentzea pudingi]
MISSVHDGVPRGGNPRIHLLRDRMRWATGTPPGRLSAMAAVLVALCLLAGLVGAVDIAQRRAALTEVTQRGIPLARAALDVYQSLSEADAAANSAFLVGDKAGPSERAGYLDHVQKAAVALSTAAANAPTATTETVARLTAQLTNYAGLVDTAHTENKRGFALGAAYLRQASALVREVLLPDSLALYREELGKLTQAQRDASSVAWLAITSCLLALAALVAVQLYLRETTRRTLNRGLLVATAAVLLSIGWLVTTSFAAANEVDTSLRGKSRTEALAEARINALTARSTEALARVERSNADPYEQEFRAARDKLNAGKDSLGSLAGAAERFDEQSEEKRTVEAAISHWRDWQELHERNRSTPATADWSGTAKLATQLDEKLAEALRRSEETFQNGAAGAVNSLRGADFVLVTSMLVAAAAAGLGMAPRIREYR